jgi:putative transcription antitermination factor YqgF
LPSTTHRGALGLIVNRPIDMSLGSLLEKIDVPLQAEGIANLPVFFGGPVQTDRGFVLHRPIGQWQSTLVVNQDVGLTSSRDILQAVASSGQPRDLMVTLGYAGWAAGQIEHELAQNAWLTVPAEAAHPVRICLTRSDWHRHSNCLASISPILPIKPVMPEAAGTRSGTVLAFDFGEKRIGVAVGDWQLRQAHPLTTIRGEASSQRFTAIAALIDEWQPTSLVVGRPLSLDGMPHAMTARCTRFANQLRGRFCLAVDHADERLSSIEAQERLRAAGHDSPQRAQASRRSRGAAHPAGPFRRPAPSRRQRPDRFPTSCWRRQRCPRLTSPMPKRNVPNSPR